MQTITKPSYLQNIRRLSGKGIFMGLSQQNVFGLDGNGKSQFDMLSSYADNFSIIEWRTDFQRLIDPPIFDQIIQTHLKAVLIRLECNNTTFKENGVLHSEHWHQFISTLKQKKQSSKNHIVLCCDRHTTFSQTLLDSLLQLREQLYPLPLLMEFEHRSWKNPNVLKVFRSIKQTVVQRDQPHLSGFQFTISNFSPKLCYIRLMGRNLTNWFSTEASQRYMHNYSKPELQTIATFLRQMKMDCDEVYVIADNKPAAVALSNILELTHLMTLPD